MRLREPGGDASRQAGLLDEAMDVDGGDGRALASAAGSGEARLLAEQPDAARKRVQLGPGVERGLGVLGRV